MKGCYIYLHLDDNDEIIYVGLTVSMEERQTSHKYDSKHKHYIKKILYADAKNKTSMILYEQYYINKYNPIYNIKDKRRDDVSFLKLDELEFKEYDKHEFKKNSEKESRKYKIEDIGKNIIVQESTIKKLEDEIQSLKKILSEEEYYKNKIKYEGINRKISVLTNENQKLKYENHSLVEKNNMLEKDIEHYRHISENLFNQNDNVKTIFISGCSSKMYEEKIIELNTKLKNIELNLDSKYKKQIENLESKINMLDPFNEKNRSEYFKGYFKDDFFGGRVKTEVSEKRVELIKYQTKEEIEEEIKIRKEKDKKIRKRFIFF